jgi:ABC-type multidrug transport system fused ATPase/permease subunit
MSKQQSAFKRYFFSTQPYWKYMYAAFFMMLIMVAVALTLPRFFKIIIDDYIPNKKFNDLVYGSLIILILYLFRMGAMILRNNRMLNFGYHYIYDLRTRLMHHFQLLSFRYYDKSATGDIMNRMLDDVMNTEYMTTNSLIYLLEDLFIISGVAIMLLTMNYKLAIIALAIIPIYSVIHGKFQKKIRDKNRSIRENYAQLSSEFHDTVAGAKVIRAFNLEDFKKTQFNKYLLEDRHLRISTYTFNALFQSLTEYLTVIGIIVVLIGGGYFAIIKGVMTAGEIVAFYTYLGYLYQPIIRLSGTTAVIEQGMSSVRRIYEVLDTAPSPPEKPNAIIPSQPARGHIKFENVYFSYDNSKNNALEGISFTVEPGRSIALVGPSGAGKSTILNLIMRFYDPTQGTIYLDGHDIRDLQLRWLRQNISLVLQEGFLFWGTIRENIRYGDITAGDKKVEQAAHLAHAHEFIQKLSQDYNTPLGERGAGLSGGQRQRIAIARAILKNAPILILDEATSALDTESEYKIQQALKELIHNKTTFIIAHRLSTIRNADEIFVMDQGKIIEKGNHDQLLAEKGLYYRLNSTDALVLNI